MAESQTADTHKPFGQFGNPGERAAGLQRYLQTVPRENVEGKPWEVIDEIEKFADRDGLPMLFRKAKREVVREALTNMEPKPKVIVEFGTFVGTSAIAWGAILRELNGPDAKDIHVYTFELDPQIAQGARDAVKLAHLDDVVTVCEGSGSDSLRKLYAEGLVKEHGVDMVFMDHWEKFYLPDLELCEELKLFREGSLAVADNVDFPGAPDYHAYVKKGGSGKDGAVRYETKSVQVTEQQHHGPARHPGPKIVEISKIVQAA
ncbi:S-adenosyl-L-methionine-dependent methyltransferase [Biscogniauxia mediterranea]|nr:S-adenosyl-L-methionine-dependent methyltransferase [Biscogniauxia mediterranea]